MTLLDRFLRYVSYHTTSDEDCYCSPSSDGQMVLAEQILEELNDLGASFTHVSKQGYVYALIPANCEEPRPTIGFIAHLDTAPDCSGANVKPRIVEYQGGDIVLNEEKGVVMSPAEFPSLNKHIGKHLVVTDGTTLLGADDKAGVAEIMTLIEMLKKTDRPHGEIRIAFTPDEEIGRGADHFNVGPFGCDFAYTVDGGGLGELEYENFNAASGVVRVKGVSIHPGSAKDKMKNSITMAMEFQAALPQDQVPEKTEGYEGFFHLTGIHGACERTELHYIIRDHDRDLFEQKKALFHETAAKLNEKYGAGTFETETTDSYYNMKEQILPHMHIIHRAEAAFKKVGVEPRTVPIRGGTDGARLSFMGLPCPNLCTGGENFHGRFEFIPVEDMETCTNMLVEILKGV